MRNYKQVNIMRVLKEERWALVRTVTAICITALTLVCLILAAGCTNDLTVITGNRGTGETLALGTLTTKDANTAQTRTDAHGASPATRADSPLPDATAWQGFRTGDRLHAVIAAGEGATFTRSSGLYEYTATGNVSGSGTWTATTPAYWQRADGNTLTLWRGPEADAATPGAYDMPLTYETNTTQGYALNAWDGNAYTTDADKWRVTDLLRYSSADAGLPTADTGIPATRSALDLTLKHSMAQLCVELLPGEGMTTEELQTQATVHLKSAAANFIMQPDGRPAIYRFENEQNRQDVRLLKNGANSRMFYALMLPGQTFGTDRVMISIHIGGTHFNYTPQAPLTATENTCHKLVLKVSRAEVNALSVTATGWQDPTVITQPEDAEAEGISVMNETPGTLKDNAALLNALENATEDVPVNLIITGNINNTDLEELSALMKYTDNDGSTKKFKVSSLIIYATGATTLPDNFADSDSYTTPNTVLKKVILPEGITNIGEEAFQYCASLTSITLPENLESIGDYAFYSCKSLTSINIPDKMTTIGDGTFESCSSLATVTLPESLESIGNDAFNCCASLTSINIPDKVNTIGDGAFESCSYLITVTLPESLESIGSDAFYNCTNLTSITIPDKVTTIADNTFNNCLNLATVTLPENLESIGNDAFYNCPSLKSINIPDKVTTIGNGTFFHCQALTSINIPGKVITIGYGTFESCSDLTTVTLPESLESIGDNAFYNCTSLTSINIPDKVTTIGDYTFNGCTALATVTLPENLGSIGKYAFSDCTSLKSIIIPDKVTTIGSNTFGFTGLTTIVLPENLESIGNKAFFYCKSLTSINIPDKVTTIAEGTFTSCSSLASITLPENLKSIGNDAFRSCTSLTSITIPDKVTTIGDYIFQECFRLVTVVLPESLGSIGNYAFSNCTSLTGIIIPDKVTTIGDYTFTGCSSLVTAVLPENLESIGGATFRSCSSLKNLVYKGTTLPDIRPGTEAFYNCNLLNSLFLPKNTSFTGESLTWLGRSWSNIYCNAKGGTDMNSIEALTNTENYQGNNIEQ